MRIVRWLLVAALPALFACNLIPKTPDTNLKLPKFDASIPNNQGQGQGQDPNQGQPQGQQPNGGPSNGGPNNGGPQGGAGNGTNMQFGGAGNGTNMGPNPMGNGGGGPGPIFDAGMPHAPSAKVMFQMMGVQ